MNLKKISVTSAALCMALAISSANNTGYTGSRIFWDTATRKTVFQDGSYARMIELKDGRLMAVCESNGIAIAFSNNKGGSWSEPTKIVTNQNNISNCVPDIIQLANGTIIVAYNPRPQKPYTTDRKFGIRCKQSRDGGATWSQEIFVNDASHTFENGCWEPSMLELPSGEVQLYFADEGPYTRSNEQQISMCRSFDGGQTWAQAQRVSFRSKHRDGMPVPVLLNDPSEVVIAIEDNGWNGINDFFPTTVRCALANNWNNTWVAGNSQNRKQTLDFNFCPVIAGGAPYLRVLPWGETLLSYQSTYGHGSKLNMLVGVGNNRAQNFKALSRPFIISEQEECLWNSLAVIDTGTVVAIGSISGKVEMIKGSVVKLLQAPYAKPKIDGQQMRNEGYYKPNATQMILGTENGVRFTGDFAYDKDSLYFTSRVSDRTQYDSGSQIDGVRLLIDTNNARSDTPVQGIFSLFFRLDGTVQAWQGSQGIWRQQSLYINSKVVRNTSKTYYVVEAAIAWHDLGKNQPPIEQQMAATIELQDRREGTVLIDKLPDANRNKPNTWMAFQLKKPEATIISNPHHNDGVSVTVVNNQLFIKSRVPLVSVSLYSIDGKMQKLLHAAGCYLLSALPFKGISLIKVALANGQVIYKKIIL